MQDRMIHPNSRVLLDAWRRMSVNEDDNGHGPQASEYPQLIDRLFVLSRTQEGNWVFSNSGGALNRIIGRELEDHEFLSLWSGTERLMMSALIDSTVEADEPSIIRMTGESLRGDRCEIEMPLAPLRGRSGLRMLGLYQSLGGEPMLRGRAVWKHRIRSIQMPAHRFEEPHIKLVANND